MTYDKMSDSGRAAVDRICEKTGRTREEIVRAYEMAALGKAVNSESLFLGK